MRKLRHLAAALLLAVVLAPAVMGGDMQGPGYTPPPPPPTSTQSQGDMGSPGDPEKLNIANPTLEELSPLELFFLGLLRVIL